MSMMNDSDCLEINVPYDFMSYLKIDNTIFY